MVSASLTAVAFVAMILPVFALDGLEKRGRIATLRLLAGSGSWSRCLASRRASPNAPDGASPS
jgi:hypothetical protein